MKRSLKRKILKVAQKLSETTALMEQYEREHMKTRKKGKR